VRGSITLNFLSLHVVARRSPHLLHEMLYIMSGWQSIKLIGSFRMTFHIIIYHHEELLIQSQKERRMTGMNWDYK